MSRDGDREPVRGETFSLRRWARRKRAANQGQEPAADGAHATASAPGAATRGDSAIAGSAALPPAAASAAPRQAEPPRAGEAPPLPPVEALSFDSDFTVFLEPRVEDSVRRAALKKLFSDPRFNVIDGLDVYLDDYSKFEPLLPDQVRTLAHARTLFDPVKTIVGEDGVAAEVLPVRPSGPAADANVASSGHAAAGPSDAGKADDTDGSAAVSAAGVGARSDQQMHGADLASAADGGTGADRESIAVGGSGDADQGAEASRRVTVAIGSKPLQPAGRGGRK